MKLPHKTIELLPKDFQDCIKSLEFRHGCPPELSVPILLLNANFAAQALTKVNPDSWAQRSGIYLSLFALMRVPASGLKSTIFTECGDGIKRFQTSQKIRYMAEIKAYKKTLKDNKGTDNDDPIIPMGYKFTETAGTLNGILDQLKLVPFFGILSPEAATLLYGHTMSDKNRSIEFAAKLSSLFSGEVVGKSTGLERFTLDNRACNMLLAGQNELVNQFLSNEMFKAQGLLNRILVCTVSKFKRPEYLSDPERKVVLDESMTLMDNFNDRIFTLLNQFETVRTNTYNSNPVYKYQYPTGIDPCELILPVMQTEKDAKNLLEVYLKEVRILEDDDCYEEWVGYLQRCQEMVFKIAATLAIYEGHDEILLDDMAASIGLMKWFNNEKIEVVPISNSQIVLDAEKIIKWISKNKHTKGTCSNNDLHKCYLWKNAEPDTRDKLLAHMDDSENCEIQWYEDTKTGKSKYIISTK